MSTVGVVVGYVISVEPHPRGDRIRLAHVDLGDAASKVQIVFGGNDNVIAGSLVPVAPPGSRVPGQRRKMRHERFRGQGSFGMLCSLTELGWAASSPDEVALLQDVEAGASLDDIPPAERRSMVRTSSAPEPVVWTGQHMFQAHEEFETDQSSGISVATTDTLAHAYA